MAHPAPTSIDQWRRYFRSINTDIFNIIEHALIIASKDFPYDFKVKKESIAEMLFQCKITKCVGCKQIEVAVPVPNNADEDDDEFQDVDKAEEEEAHGHVPVEHSKKKNEISNKSDAVYDEDSDTNENNKNNDCDGDALSEDELLREVLKIKQVLVDKSEEETPDDEELIDCLGRLKLVNITVPILRDSGIGGPVNDLRRNRRRSKEIRRVATELIKDWRATVDEFVTNDAQAATANAEAEQDEEEGGGGLPSPPLDDLEAAFLAASLKVPLSNFFDGIEFEEDDLNDLERKKKLKTVRKEKAVVGRAALARRPPRPPPHNNNNNNNNNNNSQQQQLKKQAAAPKLKKAAAGRPRNAPAAGRPESRPMGTVREVMLALECPKPPSKQPRGRPRKPCNNKNNGPLAQPAKAKAGIAVKPKPRSVVLKRPPTVIPQREKLMNDDNEESMQKKLEVAKRKLHERYQEAEIAKRQRTTQVVPLHDLPKKKIIDQKKRRKIVRGSGANNRQLI